MKHHDWCNWHDSTLWNFVCDAAAVAVIVVCEGGCVSRGGDIMHGQYALSTFVHNNTQKFDYSK